MIIVITILFFIIIAAFELPYLIKNKQWRELTVFSILFLFAFTIGLLLSMGVQVPSPIKGVIYFVKNILHISYE